MPVSRCPFRTEAGRFWPHIVFQFRLIIKQFQLRRCSALKQIDHPFDFGRKMRPALFPRLLRCPGCLRQERSQRGCTDAQRGRTQKITPAVLVMELFLYVGFHEKSAFYQGFIIIQQRSRHDGVGRYLHRVAKTGHGGILRFSATIRPGPVVLRTERIPDPDRVVARSASSVGRGGRDRTA